MGCAGVGMHSGSEGELLGLCRCGDAQCCSHVDGGGRQIEVVQKWAVKAFANEVAGGHCWRGRGGREGKGRGGQAWVG